MYFTTRENHPSGMRGVGEPRDTSDRGRSIEAIRKALDLNPVGGYVKGSAARKKLDDALKSVPITSALEIFNQLKNGVGPLGRLFQYRLHDATKPIVLNILWAKHLDQQKILKDAQDLLKRACEDQKKTIERAKVALKDYESAVERVCQTSGENSDACQKARFELLEAKTRHEDTIRAHTARCP